MNKLGKKQKALLEHALDKLYTFIKTKLNIEVTHDYYCIVYRNTVRFFQCSMKKQIAWNVSINLKKRKIIIVTREAEVKQIYSKINYEILYMGLEPTTYTLTF